MFIGFAWGHENDQLWLFGDLQQKPTNFKDGPCVDNYAPLTLFKASGLKDDNVPA